MKFLVVGDLHGSVPKLHFKDYNAIIAPGDFCSDETRKYKFQAIEKSRKKDNTEFEWWQIPGKEKAKEMIKKSLSDGREILEKLNDFDVPIYIVPGNWDWVSDEDSKWDYLKEDHYQKLIGNLENVVDVNHEVIDVNGFQIIGYGPNSGPNIPNMKRIGKN